MIMKSNLGRILLLGGAAVLCLLFAWKAMSDELHIIEVRRNIPLADSDPVYHDFYLNAGVEAGLKPNQVVTAIRKTHLKDATGIQSFGELLIPVGQLKIIFTQNHVAVAREFKHLSRDELPMLEQTGIMIGDLIETKGSFIDNRKPSAKTSHREETAPGALETSSETKGLEQKAAENAKPAETVDPQAEVMQSMAKAIDRVSNKPE